MRRAFAGALLVLVIATPGAAQDAPVLETLREDVRQAAWCIALRAQPYLVDAPSDIECEYAPRPMTVEEAGGYYRRQVAAMNYATDSRNCAVGRASDRREWAVSRRWHKRLLRASARWVDSLQAVMWPREAARQMTRLLDRVAVQDHRMRIAHTHRTGVSAISSGDWQRFLTASERASEAAAQVRQALRIRPIPTGGDSCKKARKYERQQRPQQP